MANTEQRVRDAAQELHDAIVDARAQGYVIAWPAAHGDLPAIAISETAAVKQPDAPLPATVAAATSAPKAAPAFGAAVSTDDKTRLG